MSTCKTTKTEFRRLDADDWHFHQLPSPEQTSTDFSTRQKMIVPVSFFWQEIISLMTRSSHRNETPNVPHFCNFLMVQNIFYEADFCAVNGISYVNGPYISHQDHSTGSKQLHHHGDVPSVSRLEKWVIF